MARASGSDSEGEQTEERRSEDERHAAETLTFMRKCEKSVHEKSTVGAQTCPNICKKKT